MAFCPHCHRLGLKQARRRSSSWGSQRIIKKRLALSAKGSWKASQKVWSFSCRPQKTSRYFYFSFFKDSFWCFACVCVCVPCACSMHRGQKRPEDPLRLQLGVSCTQVLGTEPLLSARELCRWALRCRCPSVGGLWGVHELLSICRPQIGTFKGVDMGQSSSRRGFVL